MKTKLSEERESRNFDAAFCDTSQRSEKEQSVEDIIPKRSFIMLRRQEIEVISRFLKVAETSINNIKDVISRCQADE